MRYARGLAVLVALAACAVARDNPLTTRAALAFGRGGGGAGLAEPLAAAGQAEALALLGLIARDAIPPETETARAFWKRGGQRLTHGSAALGRAYQLGQLGLRPIPRARWPITSAPPLPEAAVAEVNLIGWWQAARSAIPTGPRCRARLADLAEEGIPGAAVTLAEMLATGRGGSSDPDRARGSRRRRRSVAIRRRCGFWDGCELQGVGGAWTCAGGPRGRWNARRAGNGGGGDGSGAPASRRNGLPPDPGPRATGSNGRRGGGWLGRNASRAASGRRGRQRTRRSRARLCALPRGRRAGHRGGDPWAGAGLLGRGGARARPAGRAATMTRAALAGFPRALNDLGVMAETGAGGEATDPERAAELYEAAARAGDALGRVEPRRSPAEPGPRPPTGGGLCLVPLG
jgi:TPR repeat protein